MVRFHEPDVNLEASEVDGIQQNRGTIWVEAIGEAAEGVESFQAILSKCDLKGTPNTVCSVL